MAWAGISMLGRTDIAFVRGNMNSEGYQAIMEQFLLPFLDRWPSLEHVFQQDNASVHVSAFTYTWLEAKNCPFSAGRPNHRISHPSKMLGHNL